MPLTQQGHSEASKKERKPKLSLSPGENPEFFTRAETPPAGRQWISSEAGPSPPRAPPLLCHPARNRIISAKRTPPNHGRRFHLPRLYFTIPRVYKSTAFCLRIGCAIRKKEARP